MEGGQNTDNGLPRRLFSQATIQSINHPIYQPSNLSINQSIGGFISLQGNNFAVPREAAKNIFFSGC